jgi:hypothetical protein
LHTLFRKRPQFIVRTVTIVTAGGFRRFYELFSMTVLPLQNVLTVTLTVMVVMLKFPYLWAFTAA